MDQRRHFTPFCGIHRWTHGQRSKLRTSEDLRPTSSQMVLTILCRLWLYQGSYEHSHSPCHAPMHARLMSLHQPNQHSPPSMGGQSRTQPISTVNPSPPLPRTRFNPPPKMNAHSKDPPPPLQSRPLTHSIPMLDIKDTRHSAI